MTLPDSPSGNARQLLETIWQLAFGNLRWPAFAELDRCLYRGHGIQVVEVMRAIRPGFLYGIGPNSPMPPGDGQEIGLTVAGVAACPNTGEILSAFIEFMQIAVIAERDWLPPPGNPAMQPMLADTDFAARSRTLPTAGRPHLLQLLSLILRTEGADWAGLQADPETGHWTAYLTRQIRAFANLQDLGDYWSRRHKPWQASHPSASSRTSVAATLAPADGVVRSMVRDRQLVGDLPGHAFISYVREDAQRVNQLQGVLERSGIRVWRDTANIWPGQDWRLAIREAITAGSLAFIACFSKNSQAKGSSYQNAELALAADQMRLRQPGVPWLIPVRFDPCSLPMFDLGGGRMLDSLQCADLFGPDYPAQAERLVRAIQRILAGHPQGRSGYPVIEVTGTDRYADLMAALSLMDPGVKLLWGQYDRFAALLSHANFTEDQLQEILAFRGLPYHADLNVYSHEPSLVDRIYVSGPDGRNYEFRSVPDTTRLQEIASSILAEYTALYVKGGVRRPVEMDVYVLRGSDSMQLDPASTLHEAGVADEEHLAVGFRARGA